MKLFKSISIAFVLIFFIPPSYSSSVITFDDGVPDFMTLNEEMYFNEQGGNHLYDEYVGSSTAAEIIFDEPLVVNSFELNALPWEGYTCSYYPYNYPIQGYTEHGEIAFSLNVDLTGYNTWDKWLLVETGSLTSIKRLTFGPTDNCFPSIDNITVNETAENSTQSQFTPIEFSFMSNAAGFEAVGIGCDISLDITSTSALPESPVSIPELMPSTQHVYVSSSIKSEDGTQETIVISYNADDATTTSLGLRVHFDSSVLSASDITALTVTDLIFYGSVESDDGDLDGDASTDQYISFGWASLFGQWPGSVPADLASITFDITEGATGSSPINFTVSSTAAGFAFDGQDHIINFDTSATSEDNCGTPGDLSNQQAVYVASSTIVGSQKYVTIGYSSDDSTTTGLGLRVHYESDKLSLNTVIDILQADLFFTNDQNEDTNNYDENAATDSYVTISWSSLFGAWPGDNSVNLATLVFDINGYEPPTQPQQIISVNNTPKAVLGRTTVLEVAYNTTDNNNQLSGLGMRVHFDSSLFSFKEITGLLEKDIIVSGEGPFNDDTDFDNDPLTDQYMLFGWASLYNNWPDTNLPTILMNITFDVSQNIDTEAISSTNINFSNPSFTAGYEFISESYEIEILNATWDFDGNGQADALTDGLMMIRYLFGLRDDLVTDGAMAENSPFTSEQIVAEIEEAMDIADIDADGELNALTDGLLLLRYLFDLRGDLLTNGVVGLDGTRISNEDIQSHLGAHMPPI
jgi:hypothetical protein